MTAQETMTQEQVRALIPQLCGSRFTPAEKQRGDGSRYGKQHVRGEMNKTEAEYALMLTARQSVGEIASFKFEFEPLVLGKRCTYLPDFEVTLQDGTIEYVDVKGPAIDPKSIVKLKWAASKYTSCRFVVEQRLRGGKWKRTEYSRG